jgi:serine/threonine protein kinase
VLLLTDQMLLRIEYIHSKGILHRDLKPENFLIGVGNRKYLLHMIDFGISKVFQSRGQHIQFVEGKNLTGTARYASINSHNGYEQSRRDDLESIGYMMMYFLRGGLPWQGLRAYSTKQKYQQIFEKKINSFPDALFEGYPDEFKEYFTVVIGLGFNQKPDYRNLRGIFRKLLQKSGIVNDGIFDWDVIKRASSSKVKAASTGSVTTTKGLETGNTLIIDGNNTIIANHSKSIPDEVGSRKIDSIGLPSTAQIDSTFKDIRPPIIYSIWYFLTICYN